jgi:hypothetical protein
MAAARLTINPHNLIVTVFYCSVYDSAKMGDVPDASAWQIPTTNALEVRWLYTFTH